MPSKIMTIPGIIQVLILKTVELVKSRSRKSLKTGNSIKRRRKARIKLISPVSSASAVNSATISRDEAPLTILMPIPLIFLLIIEEKRLI